MISNTISRAACLAELTSNPKSFYNCPDLHGGPGLPEGALSAVRGSELYGGSRRVAKTRVRLGSRRLGFGENRESEERTKR